MVELVGPAGSGKSTIISALREGQGELFGHIGRPNPTITQRLIAAVEALPTALSPRALSLQERKRLFYAHRGIRASIRWISTLPAGVHVIDEGPHRVIHDHACFSKRHLALWRRIVSRQLSQIVTIPTLVIHLRADAERRRERRQQRMGPLEYRDLVFNNSPPQQARKLLFIRDELESLSPISSAFRTMIEVSNMTTVQAATSTICHHIFTSERQRGPAKESKS